MATPREMVRAIAIATGRPERAVKLIDRYLAAAGLRFSDGAGPTTTPMGATDVANLLIALLASDSAVSAQLVTSAFKRFEAYGVAREISETGGLLDLADEADSDPNWQSKFLAASLGDFAPKSKHTFGDIVEALLIAARRSNLAHMAFVRIACCRNPKFAEVSIGCKGPAYEISPGVNGPWSLRLLYGPPKIVRDISDNPYFDFGNLEEFGRLNLSTLVKAASILEAAQ